jgi:hypothetical protein
LFTEKTAKVARPARFLSSAWLAAYQLPLINPILLALAPSSATKAHPVSVKYSDRPHSARPKNNLKNDGLSIVAEVGTKAILLKVFTHSQFLNLKKLLSGL